MHLLLVNLIFYVVCRRVPLGMHFLRLILFEFILMSIVETTIICTIIIPYIHISYCLVVPNHL
jgi:hypothetical protein